MHYLTLVIADDPEIALDPFYEESGNIPDGYWDWFKIGGRYDGFLLVKKDAVVRRILAKGSEKARCELEEYRQPDGTFNIPSDLLRTNVARFGDIDWEGMKAEKRRYLREFWEEAHSEGIPELLGLKKTDTLEDFLKQADDPPCYAVLFRGKWHAKSKPPSFVPTKEEIENWRHTWNNIIGQVKDNELVWVVDCHV